MSNRRSSVSIRLVQTDRGWVEVDPTHCPNGHGLKRQHVAGLGAVRMPGGYPRAPDLDVRDLQPDDLRPALPRRIEVSWALAPLRHDSAPPPEGERGAMPNAVGVLAGNGAAPVRRRGAVAAASAALLRC
jgi:hypothetical protein